MGRDVTYETPTAGFEHPEPVAKDNAALAENAGKQGEKAESTAWAAKAATAWDQYGGPPNEFVGRSTEQDELLVHVRKKASPPVMLFTGMGE